jgi:hypothetical protein
VLQGSTAASANEIDTLTGGTGTDRFILGTTVTLLYDDSNTTTAGTADYALITDFNPTEGDTIELQGASIGGSTALQLQGATLLTISWPPRHRIASGIRIYRNKPGVNPMNSWHHSTRTGVQLLGRRRNILGNDSDNVLITAGAMTRCWGWVATTRLMRRRGDVLDGGGGNDSAGW